MQHRKHSWKTEGRHEDDVVMSGYLSVGPGQPPAGLLQFKTHHQSLLFSQCWFLPSSEVFRSLCWYNTAFTSPRQQTNTAYVLHLNMLKRPQWHICPTILELSKTYCSDSERLQSPVHICRCTRWKRRLCVLYLSPGKCRHSGRGCGCMDLFKSKVDLHQLAQEIVLLWSTCILPLSVSLQVSPLKPYGQMQMKRRPSPVIQVPPLRHWFTRQNSPAGGARTSEVTWPSVGASEDATKAAESTAELEHVPLISNSLNVLQYLCEYQLILNWA